jgi:dolichyl-phosphate-mannose-protein mannosyltransferase
VEGIETAVDANRRRGMVTLQDLAAPAVVGIAILAGFWLRWFDLQRWSLWWDEGFTVWASGLPLGRIIPFARSDNQAPLYYLLQHFWDLLFGNSEFALRALSALLGTLALPVFYLLAKRVLKDGMAAALAFWLFAFSMKQIWYSREARAYEAASFFALVALYALMLFLEKRSAWAFVAVVLSSAVTLYLHNMMAFYLLGLDIVWLLYPSERAWTRRIPETLLANVSVGLLCLPWAVSLLAQVTAVAGNLYWVPRPTLRTVAGTLRDTAGFDVYHLELFARKFLPLPSCILGDGIRVGLVVLCGALLAGGFWRTSKTERRKTLCFLVYCLLPIFSVFILSQKVPLYLDRIFTTSSIAVPIILAFPLVTQKGPRGKFLYAVLGLALAGVTALSSFGFIQAEEGLAKSGEDWRGVIDTVLTIPETNRLVLFVPPAGEIFFDYYSRNFPATYTRVPRNGVHEDFHSRFPPPKSRIINENDVDRLRMLVESQNYFEIDLVLAHEVDPHGLIVSYLDHHFTRQEGLAPSGSIQIIPFRALSPP